MLDSFSFAWNVIAPILLMIAAGMIAVRVFPMDRAFYKQLNTLCFRLFLPINIFCNVYKIADLSSVSWKILLFMIAGVFVSMLIGMAVVTAIPKREEKGVLVQAAFRSNNTVMGIYLASALGGAAAEAFASIVLSVIVCLYNVLAVIVLEYYAGSRKRGLKDTLRFLARNPLLIAFLASTIVLILRAAEKRFFPSMPFTLEGSLPFLYKALTDLSKVATPVMIFVLGAQLDFSAAREKLGRIALGVSLRLVIIPAICLTLTVLLRGKLGIGKVEFPSILAMFASPAAVSGSVMVAEIGGDSQLASQIIVWSSAFSMLTLFIFIYVFRSIGLL